MNIWLIILELILLYFIAVFGLSRFVIPHLGNGADPLSENIPEEMSKKIAELKAGAKTKEEFLAAAYQYLGKKNRSERLETIIKFDYLFKNLDQIWRIDGYIPCTQSNYCCELF
jgi:predicted hydrocarbon binding protein